MHERGCGCKRFDQCGRDTMAVAIMPQEPVGSSLAMQ